MLSPRIVLGWNLRIWTILLVLLGLTMLPAGIALAIVGVVLLATGLFLWFVGGQMIRQGREAQQLNPLLKRYEKSDRQVLIMKRAVWAAALIFAVYYLLFCTPTPDEKSMIGYVFLAIAPAG